MSKIFNNVGVRCYVFITLFTAILIPLTATAETVVRTGESVSIGVNQIVENNLYAAGGNIALSGEVRGDMYALGGSATINGPIGSDLTVVGGNVNIHSNVGDDLRVVAGNVVVGGEVGGDVFVFGGYLKVLSSARVAGNVYFYGGEAEIDGEVSGVVMGQAEKFVINSSVAGTDLIAYRLVLGDQANITGDLRYRSSNNLERAVGATVEGEVVAVADTNEERPTNNTPLLILLSWFFTSLCALLFFRNHIEKMLAYLRQNPARMAVTGLAALLLAPTLSFILILTFLGSWLGIIMLLATMLVFLATLMILPILLGGYLLGLYRKNFKINIWSTLIGLGTVLVLAYIPFIGPLALAAIFILSLGAATYAIYRLVRS